MPNEEIRLPIFDNKNFKIFQEKLDDYFKENHTSQDERKNILLSALGRSANITLKELCHPDLPSSKTYEELSLLLRKEYTKRNSALRQRVAFYRMKQKKHEVVKTWHKRVIKSSQDCAFAGNVEEILRDRFVSGLRPGPILERLCEEDESETLEYLLSLALDAEKAERKKSRSRRRSSSDDLDSIENGGEKDCGETTEEVPQVKEEHENGETDADKFEDSKLHEFKVESLDENLLTPEVTWEEGQDVEGEETKMKGKGRRPYKFKCTHCPKKFPSPCHVKMHFRVHTGEKPHVCKECGKSFAQKGSLITHARLHSGEKPFVCDCCGKGFNQKLHLIVHMRGHTGEKPFACPQCPKSFRTKVVLESHFRLHSGEKPFVCSYCGKSFRSHSPFVRHTRVHTGEKPYHCTHCPKQFTSNSNLKAHLKIHTGEKPFECSFCQRRFALKCTLQVHERVHTSNKPFLCTFANCLRRLSNEKAFRKHMRFHVEEKRFVCPHCNKACVNKVVLENHINLHTGERPFVCSFCRKGFTGKMGLKRHLNVERMDRFVCKVLIGSNAP